MTSETFRRKYKQFYLLGPNGKKHPRWANDDISHIIATSRGGAQCLENVFMFNFQFNRAIGAIQAVGDPINCALVGLERAKRAVKASREHGDYMGADGEYLHMMGMELLGHMGIKAKKDGGIIEWTAKRYEDWETMHDPNVMWFDTAACLDGGHIGNVNAISFQPTTERFSRRTRID